LGLESDRTFYDVQVVLLTGAAVSFGLLCLIRRLHRSRPGMNVGLPITVAVAVRVLAAIGVSLTGVASTLRGGDEIGFLEIARDLAGQSLFSNENFANLTADLHVWLFGLQARFLDAPQTAMRIVQIGIAVTGLVFLVTAVYDLAGSRASGTAAWLLALEPTSVFFSSLLHKEPNMLLAGGLVAYGGARMWSRGEVAGLLPVAAGCLVGVATRPYVGWFLITAGALITLHAASRRPQLSSVVLVAAAALTAAAIVVPFAFEKTTDESLEKNLQSSQDANARDNANLRLERVDYSTRQDIILNLPQRLRDVVLRPYPWQLGNIEQRTGLPGTLVALTVLGFLVVAVSRSLGNIMARAGPLMYVGLMLLVAYSLSAGNAGTAFRYRTHLVIVALCVVVVLREFLTARAMQRAPTTGGQLLMRPALADRPRPLV
jgi:hypothetical protein